MLFKAFAPLLALGAVAAATPLQLQISVSDDHVSSSSNEVSAVTANNPFNLVALDAKTLKPIRNDYDEDFFLGIHPARIFPPLVSLVTPAFARYELFMIIEQQLRLREISFQIDLNGLLTTHILGGSVPDLKWDLTKDKDIYGLVPVVDGKKLPHDSFRVESFHLGSRVYVCVPGKTDDYVCNNDKLFKVVFRALNPDGSDEL